MRPSVRGSYALGRRPGLYLPWRAVEAQVKGGSREACRSSTIKVHACVPDANSHRSDAGSVPVPLRATATPAAPRIHGVFQLFTEGILVPARHPLSRLLLDRDLAVHAGDGHFLPRAARPADDERSGGDGCSEAEMQPRVVRRSVAVG